jgi:ATP-binding protein involved in chromosome partitioning
MMMGMGQDRPIMKDEMIVPIERYDVRTMSIGSLIDRDTPIIWRGPMASKALDQLMGEVNWTGVETLVLDLPPGTGDIQITLAQRVSLTGAVIVTTPQDVALVDAAKGVGMFRKVQVPVLGMIENMSAFICPHCGKESEVFGPTGTEKEAARLGVPVLGSIPIDPRIATGGDAGTPIVREAPDSPAAVAFRRVAKRIREGLQ